MEQLHFGFYETDNEIADKMQDEWHKFSDAELMAIEDMCLSRIQAPVRHLTASQIGIFLSEIRQVDKQVKVSLMRHIGDCHDCLMRVLRVKRRKAQTSFDLTNEEK